MKPPVDLTLLLRDHRGRQSTFQNRRFVTLKAGKTTYGCYRQALRELSARTSTLQEAYADLELLRIDVEELEARREWSDDFERRRDEVRLLRARARVARAERDLAEGEAEWGEFYGQAVALRRALGLADDEALSEESRAEHEADFWRAQLAAQGRARRIARDSRGLLDPNLAEAILSLPPDSRDAVLEEIERDPAPGAQRLDLPAPPELDLRPREAIEG